MLENLGFALLIGVDDYRAFDASRGQPEGNSDLPGSRNDARAFFHHCLRLGFRPENIRVLTSPRLDPRELEGAVAENLGEATEAEIRAQLTWLVTSLAGPSRPSGLMTFSGHGDATPTQGLVLCPSDVTHAGEAAIAHAIALSEIDALLAEHGVGDELTLVLDTCHAGETTRPGSRSLSLLPRRESSPARTASDRVRARVLAAARRDQVAHQSRLDGRYRGVFSWALGCAMEQWKATQEGEGTRLDVSYGKLVETAQRLMTGLWFDQHAELRGPTGLADLAVLQRGLDRRPGATAERPNGDFKTAQLDPGTKGYLIYELTQNGNPIGQVLVTNTAGGGYEANREYWYLTQNVSMASALTFTSGAAQYWTTPPSGLSTLSFVTERRPTWTTATPSGTLLVETVAGTTQRYAIKWQMTANHGTWGGSITWWNTSTGNMFGENQTNTLTPGAPPTASWKRFITAPL